MSACPHSQHTEGYEDDACYRNAEEVLVAHAIMADGKRTLLGVILGGRESTDSWRGLLMDLEDRGLRSPALVVHDGNAGLIKALKTVWKDVPRQRCIAHKIRNVLNRGAKKNQVEVKRTLRKIFYAANLEEALEAVKVFAAKHGKRHDRHDGGALSR